MIARVYTAINAVSAALAQRGVPKERVNVADDYVYRSIDDVLDRLAPLLAEHKLCILPRVLNRKQELLTQPGGEVLVHVTLRVAFDLVSAEDGSSHTIEAFGEALDYSDKGTAKAMSSAYKYAVLQAFCVPVMGSEDGDAASPRHRRDTSKCEPVNGWAQWAADIGEMVASCMTCEAIDRVVTTHRPLLAALAREQPELYAKLGENIAARRTALSKAAAPISVKPATAARRPQARPAAGSSKAHSVRKAAEPVGAAHG